MIKVIEGKIIIKSKNILITNIISEIIIKRYQLIRLYENYNLKDSQVIDKINSKNY